MKSKLFAAGLLAFALVSPVAAQTAPDDLHCFMLSNFFAKAAKDDRSKGIAAQSAIFYLGRLDGHLNSGAIAAAMHEHLDSKTAGTQMMACAQHLGRAEQTIQTTIRSLAPKH